MKSYITLYEGECEKSILEWLKINDYTFGRLIKREIANTKNITRVLNMITKKTVVIIVMDMDTINTPNFNIVRFESNIKKLKKMSKEVKIITQKKNLEDELKRALQFRNFQQLYSYFDSEGKKEYKSKLAKLGIEQLEIKFKTIDLDKFWSSKIISSVVTDPDIVELNCTLKDIK